MALHFADGHSGVPRRRPAVRIIPSPSESRAARINLLLLAAVALAIVLLYRAWSREEQHIVDSRQASDLVWDWRCESSHNFQAPGQSESLRCPTCSKPAHPIALYRCESHGNFELLARFTLDSRGIPWMSHVQHTGKPWVEVDSGLVCPVCAEELSRVPVDPLSAGSRERGFDGP